jgi:NTP pyrophosphatase (non-canonical NTP hydrolase)
MSESRPTSRFGALTFAEFRKANVTRCVKWHPQGIESWSPSDWLTAVTGELGELASLLKMRNRERDGLPGNKFSPSQKQIADELADVLTYLDLLAAALGVDLANAAAEKFNEVSERVGFPDRIEGLGVWNGYVKGMLNDSATSEKQERFPYEVREVGIDRFKHIVRVGFASSLACEQFYEIVKRRFDEFANR